MISAPKQSLLIALPLVAAIWYGVSAKIERAAAAPPGGERLADDIKISPVEQQLLSATADDAAGVLASVPVPAPTATPAKLAAYGVLEIEFKDSMSCQRFKLPQGVTAFHKFDRFMGAFVDLSNLSALQTLLKAKEIRWIDVGQNVSAPPPPKMVQSEEKSRGEMERIIRGGLDGLTGKGVIVAILDTGVDFRHKDFITVEKDGRPSSRLLYFWDTLTPPIVGKAGSKAPLSYPNGASIGTLYTREELTAELRNPKEALPVPDSFGHGTSCAGIAVGNGASTAEKRYTGVAPGADLIAVRLGSGPGIQNAYLLNAVCSWLDRVVGDKPLVVSCSFGGQYGGHDGARITERQLDAQFPLGKKGRAICIAAGNEAERLPHGRINLGGGKAKGSLNWTPNPLPAQLQLYIDTDQPQSLELDLRGYSDPNLSIKRYVHPLSGSVVFEIVLPASKAQRAELEIASTSRKPLNVDAYFQTPFTTQLQGFKQPNASKSYLISSPGCCANAITVGSYDFNDTVEKEGIRIHLADSQGHPLEIGALSSYSNRGYLRNRDVIKPDIVAPGQWSIAPTITNSRRYSANLQCGYRAFNGTSAATPYVAGVIALLLEQEPDLTVGQIHQLLRICAAQDTRTGRLPNTDWGNGKLSYESVQKMVHRNRNKPGDSGE